MIRDSRMFLDGDGENADSGGVPLLEAPVTRASKYLHNAQQEGVMQEGAPFEASSQNSLAFELNGDSGEKLGGLDLGDPPLDKSPTPPPKSPLHRSTSGSSGVYVGTPRSSSESTIPSLCPSSPRSCSSGSTEPSFHVSPARVHSPLPPLPSSSHIHVHVDADHSGHPEYSELFAHHRHTQLLTSDLLASLEYNYSDALSHLGNSSAGHSPVSLFPSGDFEPGSSAGTIKNVFSQTHAPSEDSDDGAHSHWSSENDRLSVPEEPLSPRSPPELHSSSSEDISTESSVSPSPISRSRSSSTVSSEYDFADEEDGYYSYDVGPFQDPLGSPPTAGRQRSVFGYGIPWPSTRRQSAQSGGSGGSGGSSVADVLSDLEDLAEDVTERFSLRPSSSDNNSLETERAPERRVKSPRRQQQRARWKLFQRA
ncbi:hypothetical protein BD309DRAFT_357239 [Dichomitus squalens]|nr:hypothetical protein BD309DRAFT_357239 [Dichomitus squalens]